MSALKKNLDDVFESIVYGLRHAGDGITMKVGHMRDHLDDVVMKLKDLDNSLSNAIHGTHNLPPSKVQEILSIPKPNRPDPRTYMSQAEIDRRLQPFRDSGGIRVTSRASVAEHGTIGPKDGTFILPMSEFNALEERTGGDLQKIEEALGLTPGQLQDGDTMILYIAPEHLMDLRMPDGNELGANDNWLPEGRTSGGVSEATVNAPSNLPYTEVTIGQ